MGRRSPQFSTGLRHTDTRDRQKGWQHSWVGRVLGDHPAPTPAVGWFHPPAQRHALTDQK